MEYKSTWEWLGIAPTDNRDEIKEAFAKQAKIYHPEEHPEEFRMLRKAYQSAISGLKKPKSIVTMDLNDRTNKNVGYFVLKEEIQNDTAQYLHQQDKTLKEIPTEQLQEQQQEEQPTEQRVEQPAEQPAEPVEANLNYNAVYDKIRLAKKEEYLEKVIEQLRTLTQSSSRNQLYRYKRLLECEESKQLYNGKDFTRIIRVALNGGMNAEIYGYLCSLADSFEWDEKYIVDKDWFHSHYKYILQDKKGEDPKIQINPVKSLEQVMKEIEDLAQNGVGKDNLNLWKDIIEYGNVSELYNPEDFGKILRYIISQDQLKGNILTYFCKRAELVEDTSISFRQAYEAVRRKAIVKNKKEHYIARDVVRSTPPRRQEKMVKNHYIAFSVIVSVIAWIVIEILSHSAHETETVPSTYNYQTMSVEELQKKQDELNSQLQSMEDSNNSSKEEKTYGSNRD